MVAHRVGIHLEQALAQERLVLLRQVNQLQPALYVPLEGIALSPRAAPAEALPRPQEVGGGVVSGVKAVAAVYLPVYVAGHGVEQRARMWTKNEQPPHVLVMTATPIPRTLAMTLYGDLDVSVIDELPPGRRPVQTVHYTDAMRLRVWGFLRKQIAQGRQVYIVYPLIEESEAMDYKNLQEGYEAISRDFPLPEYVTEVVHGRMKPQDKEAAMRRFKSGEAQLLVATSVIEVGVDVPNATVMVIESAERFGLSQLHQLRGRVGRGAQQSYCILMSGEKLSKESRARLDAMCETNDGFRLAELDLKLRGAGDLAGTQQSGMAFDLKIANPTLDVQILERTRDAAGEVLAADPTLAAAEHAGLRQLKKRYSGEKSIDFSMIS